VKLRRLNGERGRRLVAGLLPVLGVSLLVARGEWQQRSGAQFRLRIAAYDPRDALRGQYLSYRYELDWQGTSSCGVQSAGRLPELDATCCICMNHGATLHGAQADSGDGVRQVACEDVQGSDRENSARGNCGAWVPSAALQGPQRYWVPEARAAELSSALRAGKAAVDVRVNARGHLTAGDLYLDGRAWRWGAAAAPP
jgi:uncharacterized membrane-anchored protein